MKNNKNQVLDETIVNGSRVFIENGEVKTELNEDIKNTGRMCIEDVQRLTIDKVKKIHALSNENEWRKSVKH